MAAFGESLFAASHFVRWSLSPFLLLSMASMPFLVDGWTPLRVAFIAGMELLCLALLAGFWLSSRWAVLSFRIFAAMIFLAYAAYLCAMLLSDGSIIADFQSRRSEPSAKNAVLGFFVIGLPCLWFAVFGRFRAKSRSESVAEDLAAGRNGPL